MLYQYLACDAHGRTVRGVIESDSEAAAEAQLWQANLIIIDLRPQVTGRWLMVDWAYWLQWFWPVTTRDLDGLWEPLADLLAPSSRPRQVSAGLAPRSTVDEPSPDEGIGLPLPTALRLLRERATHPALSRLLEETAEAAAAGEPLSAALEARTAALLPVAGRLLRAAEERGDVVPTLRALAALGADDRSRLAPLRAALGRSVLLLAGASAVGILLLWVFVPLLLGAEGRGMLTWPAAWLLGAARLGHAHFWPIVAVIAVLTCGAAVARQMVFARRWATTIAWHLPLVGLVMQGVELARFCRSLALMLEAGLPWAEVLDLLPHSTPDPRLQEILMQVRSDVLDGASLSDAIRRQPLLPPSLSEVLALAFTGRGERELGSVATDARKTEGLAALGVLVEYYEAQARSAALQMATVVWRTASVLSLGATAWVVLGLAPAWRAAIGGP